MWKRGWAANCDTLKCVQKVGSCFLPAFMRKPAHLPRIGSTQYHLVIWQVTGNPRADMGKNIHISVYAADVLFPGFADCWAWLSGSKLARQKLIYKNNLINFFLLPGESWLDQLVCSTHRLESGKPEFSRERLAQARQPRWGTGKAIKVASQADRQSKAGKKLWWRGTHCDCVSTLGLSLLERPTGPQNVKVLQSI